MCLSFKFHIEPSKHTRTQIVDEEEEEEEAAT